MLARIHSKSEIGIYYQRTSIKYNTYTTHSINYAGATAGVNQLLGMGQNFLEGGHQLRTE